MLSAFVFLRSGRPNLRPPDDRVPSGRMRWLPAPASSARTADYPESDPKTFEIETPEIKIEIRLD